MDYCTTLMDSVHQNGTLYTTIYDLKNGKINLYYNHNYKNCISLNLKEELKKGNRILSIPELFPAQKTSAFTGYKNLKLQIDSMVTLDKNAAARVRLVNGLTKLEYLMHILGNYGYENLHSDNIPKAIGLFKLFIELYPDSPDGYDCLG